MKTEVGHKIKIMVVDDHMLIRMGLVTASKVERDLTVVAEAEDGEAALEGWRKHRPDVTVMDLRLPGMDGIATIKALRQEFAGAKILVLSTYGSEEDIYRAVQAGAAGYLLKDMPLKQIVEAIRTIHSGQNYFPAEISSRIANRLNRPVLTARELDVLQMVAKGRSNREIGDDLGIVEGTVKAHITNIFAKLHAVDRTQAVTNAMKQGVLQIQ